MLKLILRGATGCSICALLSTSVMADSRRLEEVIVTAQKRDENIQEVPISITAITGQELESRGISDFKGVLEDTPSVYSAPYILSATGSLQLSMRGLTQKDPDDINQESPVGLYRDGFYISRGQMMSVDLADVERVEVLRGPQGTLYGRNTTAGAINIISKKPTGDFGFKQKISLGNRDYIRSLTGINFPAIADIATKLTLLKSTKDGYTHNPGMSHDFGEEARKGARFDVAWNPASNFSAEYFLEMGNSYSTPIYLRVPELAGKEISYNNTSYIYPSGDGPEGTAPRPFDLIESKSRSNGNGLTMTWDVSDSLTLKSLTSYLRFTGDSASDLSDVRGVPMVEYRDIGGHQFSQEIQAIGGAFGERLTYVAGLYYFSEGASLDDLITVDNGSGRRDAVRAYLAKSQAKSKAIYGQLNWTPPIMNDQLDIIIGARYNQDDREGSKVLPLEGFSRGEYSESSNRFSPSLTFNYRWSEDVSTYATVATGYKAGGAFQEADFEPPASPTVKPEKLTNYEIGMKSYWLDQTIRANISGFISKLEDRQLVFGLPNPDNPLIFSQFGVNVGESTISGLEVELQAQPTDNLVVSLSYAYIHTDVDFPAIAGSNYDGNSPAGMAAGSPYSAGDDISSEFPPSANPKHAGSIAIDYTVGRLIDGEVSLHLDYRYQGKLEGPDIPGGHFQELPGYGVLNGRINWAFDLDGKGSLQLGLWSNNLLDKEYRLFVTSFGGTGTSFAPPGSVPGWISAAEAWAEPMSVGIDITYEY